MRGANSGESLDEPLIVVHKAKEGPQFGDFSWLHSRIVFTFVGFIRSFPLPTMRTKKNISSWANEHISFLTERLISLKV